MKDLGAAKQILGTRITRDRKNHKLTLSQGEYIEKVLERLRMQNEKPVSVDDIRSTSGMPFFLGNCLVSWSRKKQSSVSLSTTEA